MWPNWRLINTEADEGNYGTEPSFDSFRDIQRNYNIPTEVIARGDVFAGKIAPVQRWPGLLLPAYSRARLIY